MRSFSPGTGSRKFLYLGLLLAILCAAIVVGHWAVESSPEPQVLSPALPTKTISLNIAVTAEFKPSSTPETTLIPSATGLSAAEYPIVLIGTVIDGTGAEPLPDSVIIIEGDQIVAVGSIGEVEIPADAYVFDLPETTILPGFINAHVHNAYDSALLTRWAQEGVTMVRDLGAKYPFIRFPVRDKNNQNPEYSTVIAAGPLVTVPKGYPIAGPRFLSMTVTSEDQARRKITELIEQGADVIKIVIQEDADIPTLPFNRAVAIVETAHQYGIPVSAHITTVNDLRFA
ncbi:MAG: hypothetical protein ACK2T7_06845, partial [Anaerolineales bacterium]